MTLWKGLGALIVSCFLVAFAQPSWLPWLGPIAAAAGYALCWSQIARETSAWRRFWVGTLWMTVVQGIQWSWFLQHQYRGIAITLAYLLLILLWGAQHGLFSVLLGKISLSRLSNGLALAGVWVLMEWSRYFVLSGSAWNQAGHALTTNLYSMQMASLSGSFGLTFWVIWTNSLLVRAWCKDWCRRALALWLAATLFPFAYGYAHIHYHHKKLVASSQAGEVISVALVQTAQPPTDCLPRDERRNLFQYAYKQWEDAFQDLKKENSRQADLVVFPEVALPFGTFLGAYLYDQAAQTFLLNFGAPSLQLLPPLEKPYATTTQWNGQSVWLVSNAFFAQGLANTLQADVIMGMDYGERQEEGSGERSFNSARLFSPERPPGARYDKRVLVPMGEYIPCTWLKSLAARFGVVDSFTPGKHTQLLQGDKITYGMTICYEETFSHIMRQTRNQGAELLVNVTSDAWFPNSRLPLQHFHHARLRTVETGAPLVRACNTGLTSAIDSLGQIVAVFGDENGSYEWIRGVLKAEVPLYSYRTLYTTIGDGPLLGLSAGLCFFLLPRGRKGKRRG